MVIAPRRLESGHDMSDRKEIPYLSKSKSVSWDWWSESPVELILMVFIIVFFFAFPRAGCGITPTADAPPANSAADVVVD